MSDPPPRGLCPIPMFFLSWSSFFAVGVGACKFLLTLRTVRRYKGLCGGSKNILLVPKQLFLKGQSFLIQTEEKCPNESHRVVGGLGHLALLSIKI